MEIVKMEMPKKASGQRKKPIENLKYYTEVMELKKDPQNKLVFSDRKKAGNVKGAGKKFGVKLIMRPFIDDSGKVKFAVGVKQ